MKATLKNYRQSPRKVRLVADLVRGMRADDALVQLTHVDKRAADPIRKLVISAMANAREAGAANPGDLIIARLTVDEGPTLRRFIPRAFGRATRILKRSSHISVVLAEQQGAEAQTAESPSK